MLFHSVVKYEQYGRLFPIKLVDQEVSVNL